MLQHALLLIARQHGGTEEEARLATEELTLWRKEAPAHEQAWQAAQHAWQMTDARELQDSVERPLTANQRKAQTRRRVLLCLPLLALFGLTGTAAYRLWQRPSFELALQSGHGRLLGRSLPDGSRLDLAANTSAQITYHRNRREVLLHQGEILFDVQSAQAPFLVISRWGSVRVLGTGFSVSTTENSTTIRVAHGKVALWLHPEAYNTEQEAGSTPTPAWREQWLEKLLANQGALTTLSAGQAITLRKGKAEEQLTINTTDVGAWRQGWLAFNATPLNEAVASWNNYLSQPLLIAADAPLQELRITGSFRIADPHSFLNSLPRILPVCVTRTSNQQARIEACKPR